MVWGGAEVMLVLGSHCKYRLLLAERFDYTETTISSWTAQRPQSVACRLLSEPYQWVTIVCVHAKSLQLYPTLCDLVDCSLTGSSVQGILQARILEWVAMTSSRYSSPPRDQTHISCVSYIGRWVLYHSRHLGPLHFTLITSLKPCLQIYSHCV